MQYRRSAAGGGMSAAPNIKLRDPRHLLDTSLTAPDAAPPATPCDSPAPPAPASLAAVVMANSVEGPAPQPSSQPTTSAVETAAPKEERRPSEPVPKKRRLLQATEAEQVVEAQDEREDILAQAISAVGIDYNIVESEVEDPPYSNPGEGVFGLHYPKELRPLLPRLPPPLRMRLPDPRVGARMPPAIQTLDGAYVVTGVPHPYPPYPFIPHDRQGTPHYRPLRPRPPRHYSRPPPLPAKHLGQLSTVMPSDRHLPPPHGSPTLPPHFRSPPIRPPPAGPSPVHQPHEARHVLTTPSKPPLPGSSTESPSHLYHSGSLVRPDLKEVYVPVLPLPGAPYPNLRPRVPEGFTRIPYDPRAIAGREITPPQVVINPRLLPPNPLPPRLAYPPDRFPAPESTLRPQPTKEDSWRPSRRVMEPPVPSVELIPLGPARGSTDTVPSSEAGHLSHSDNQPSTTLSTEARQHMGRIEVRRQSAPVISAHPPPIPPAHRSLSSEPPLVDTVTPVPLVEARHSGGRVVTNIIPGDRVHNGRNSHMKRSKRTPKTREEEEEEKEEASSSSADSDVIIEKVVCNTGANNGKVIPRNDQSSPPNITGPSPLQCLRTCRPASEPPSHTLVSPITGKRPASLPAPVAASGSCSQGMVSEDAVFRERLQLVLNDLVSVPGATELQELSHSPARLLNTLVRRWGIQPSTNPNFQKRLREDFKTMVLLCMPPTLLQEFGWESCSSDQILAQLFRLSHNGDTERRSSISSVPVDEVLEDDVFSPSTPQSLPSAPQTSHTSPTLSQLSPIPFQSSHTSPPAPHPSQTPPLSSQPSHHPTPVPQSSLTPPSGSKTPQPQPQIPQTKPPFSQPLTSQPPTTTSHISQPPPTTRHPSQPQPMPSQPCKPPPLSSQLSQPSPTTSQPNQPPPLSSQLSQPPPTTYRPSQLSPVSPQSPQNLSPPSQPPPLTSQPSQDRPTSPHPSLLSYHLTRPVLQASQGTQPPPLSPQSPKTAPKPPQSQLSVPQSFQPPPLYSQPPLSSPTTTQAIQPPQPPPLSSHSSQSRHSAPQPQVSPSQLSPSAPKHVPLSPTLPSLPSHLIASRPTHLPPHVLHPTHPMPRIPHHHTHRIRLHTPTSPPSHFHPPASHPSHIPLYVSQHHPSQPPRPSHLPAPSSQPSHLPPSPHPSQPVPHSPQPSHIPHVSQPSHLPPHPSPPYRQPHPARPTRPSHALHPVPHSPHGHHTVFRFPSKAEELAFSHLRFHLQYQRPSPPYRLPTHPTRPTQPPPYHVSRNPTPISPGDVDAILRQQQQQHQQSIRLPPEKWIDGDGVARPAGYTATNGQASPPKSLPT